MGCIRLSVADLIRRLATDFDGEVVATVRAIDRKLRAAGCDWHDLARVATAQAHQEELEGWHDMVRFCERKAERLRDREREFIGSLNKRRGDLTEKQMNWLKDIVARLKGRGELTDTGKRAALSEMLEDEEGAGGVH
jgi:hypothetical protein